MNEDGTLGVEEHAIEFEEACYNVIKGVKPCHCMDYEKGILKTGEYRLVKLYVIPLDDKLDEIFIYKYDFMKDIIEFVITLNKRDRLRQALQGLLFGYGLAEIDEFTKDVQYCDELAKEGKIKALITYWDGSTEYKIVDKNSITNA